jgi:hypothetical protein
MRLALISGAICACLFFMTATAPAQWAPTHEPATAEAAPQADPPRPARKATSGRQKTLVVISDIGETLNIRRVGGNFFEQGSKQLAIGTWKVDDRVAAQVTSLLKKRYKVKRVAAPPATFSRLPDPTDSMADFDRSYKYVLQKIAGAEKADFYLAVTPGYSRFDNAELVSGLGIVQRDSLLSKGETVHCLVLYRLYDAQFNLVRSGGAMVKREFSDTVNGPNAPLSTTANAADLKRDLLSLAKDPRAKDIALDLLDKDIAATVPTLFPRS